MNRTNAKGFTLLELLIVIAILAILASVTFIALNPAELLKKSRDTQRMADLASMRTALNYYITNASSSAALNAGSATAGCADDSTKYTFSAVSGVAASGTTASSTTTQTVNGAGWVPVDMSGLTGGAPLAKWAIDPNPTTSGATPGRYYAYLCNHTNTTFELFANMESSTYQNGGAGDVESKDGGSLPTVYEVGTALNLATATATNFYAGSN